MSSVILKILWHDSKIFIDALNLSYLAKNVNGRVNLILYRTKYVIKAEGCSKCWKYWFSFLINGKPIEQKEKFLETFIGSLFWENENVLWLYIPSPNSKNEEAFIWESIKPRLLSELTVFKTSWQILEVLPQLSSLIS